MERGGRERDSRQNHPCLLYTSRTNGFVSGTDDFAVVGKLFHAVCAPAHHTCDGEYRSIQLSGKAEHVVNEAGIEVYVYADALVHLSFPGNNAGGELFHQIVKFKFLMKPFFFRKMCIRDRV